MRGRYQRLTRLKMLTPRRAEGKLDGQNIVIIMKNELKAVEIKELNYKIMQTGRETGETDG